MSKSGATLKYIKYDIQTKEMIDPIPAYNMGANCWWNALLQCLFSCPAFIESLKEAEEEYKSLDSLDSARTTSVSPGVKKSENSGRYLISSLLNLLKEDKNVMNTPAALMVFAKICQIKNLSLDLMSQEGTANGFIVLLEAIGYNPLSFRFRNKYLKTISCENCKKSVSQEEDRNVFITLYDHHNLKSQEDFEKYIIQHTSPLHNYKCESCGKEMLLTARIETLRLLREVMILVVNRGINSNSMSVPVLSDLRSPASLASFLPKEITMPGVNNDVLRWRYIGRIQHSGFVDPRSFVSSGHYWADVCRFNKNSENKLIEKWYNVNDSSVRKIWEFLDENDINNINSSICKIDANTHMIFYHMC
jgi:ubiquitin C-terminal hydrolase